VIYPSTCTPTSHKEFYFKRLTANWLSKSFPPVKDAEYIMWLPDGGVNRSVVGESNKCDCLE